MGFIYCNPNPKENLTGDCVIRAICIAENKSWDEIFLDLMIKCFELKDMPSDNATWNKYLQSIGYKRHIIPDTCPDCYTVNDFTKDNPKGVFILGTGTHVIAVKDGNHYDTWDSGTKIPIYYWSKESTDYE